MAKAVGENAGEKPRERRLSSHSWDHILVITYNSGRTSGKTGNVTTFIEHLL